MSPARNSNIEYEMHFKCKLAETQSKPLSRIISYPHKLDSDLYEAERGDGSLPVLNWMMGGGFLWEVVVYLFVERALFEYWLMRSLWLKKVPKYNIKFIYCFLAVTRQNYTQRKSVKFMSFQGSFSFVSNLKIFTSSKKVLLRMTTDKNLFTEHFH